MNPFAQKIGIYYDTIKWADYIFNTIVEENKDIIEKYINSKYDKIITFKDNTVIKFYPMVEGVRGYRHTKAYIQNENLDKHRDFVEMVIYPCLTLGNNPECYILSEYEDLFKPCTTAKDFYYECDWGSDWHELIQKYCNKKES